MAGCCPHTFVASVRAGKGGQQVTVYGCTGCTWELAAAYVRVYELGVDHGRQDAWSKPPRQKLPRWAVAVLVSLGLPLVGAGPIDTLPPPPPHEGLEGLGKCLKAASALEQDVEILWGRQLGTRCKNEICLDAAKREAEFNRTPARDAAKAALEAQQKLSYVLEDARVCAKQQIPGCVVYQAPVLASLRAGVEETSTRLEATVCSRRFTMDTASP